MTSQVEFIDQVPPTPTSLDGSLSKEEISDNMSDTSSEHDGRHGRTWNGTTFIVPHTHDMFKTVLDPKLRKTTLDLITIGTLVLQCYLFFILGRNPTFRAIFFFVLFALWRSAYNIGLGILLKKQSEERWLVNWLAKSGLLNGREGGKGFLAHWAVWIRGQLEQKMGPDYDFDAVPIEFNAWLLFRQLVDLVLCNDFTSYLCFALACMHGSAFTGSLFMDILRWAAGIVLLVFNLWVKSDAHRVVKDFAWYWGDFFFLIDQSLTFDGVFEMAPHPMYSVGYAGYYGVSLITNSYAVLFVSLAAHMLQFAFLTFVENPHIEKTYNAPSTTPPPRRRSPSIVSPILGDNHIYLPPQPTANDLHRVYFRRDLLVFKNFDLTRSSDLLTIAVILYSIVFAWYAPAWAVVGQAVMWRLIHTYGLGIVLWRQSNEKWWVRRRIEQGGSVREAFASWKSLYNLSLCMTYVSSALAAWTMYTVPSDWTYGTVLLRHTLAVLLIALHSWTAVSVFEVLGDFGWFYGDFFIEEYPTTLYYTGIYRFLNNPEKIVGHAAFWGLALFANHWSVYLLVMFSQVSNLLFHNYVESPHMRRLYGDRIRREAGLTKNLRRPLRAARRWAIKHISVAKTIDDQWQYTEMLIKARLNALSYQCVQKVIKLTQQMIQWSQAALDQLALLLVRPRVSLVEITAEEERAKLSDLDAYHVSLVTPQLKLDGDANSVLLGEPIRVRWRAPSTRTEKDWIGIYPVEVNPSPIGTTASSHALWQWVPSDTEVTEGEMVFERERLPFFAGTYELRYHRNGKYTVLARSEPFVITVRPVPADDMDLIKVTLMDYVQRCYYRDAELMPINEDDELVSLNDQRAKRIAHGIKLMYGISFHAAVIQMDGTVARLARRIWEAKCALAPFKPVCFKVHTE